MKDTPKLQVYVCGVEGCYNERLYRQLRDAAVVNGNQLAEALFFTRLAAIL